MYVTESTNPQIYVDLPVRLRTDKLSLILKKEGQELLLNLSSNKTSTSHQVELSVDLQIVSLRRVSFVTCAQRTFTFLAKCICEKHGLI